MTLPFSVTILGRPVTKKNHGVTAILPSKAYLEWIDTLRFDPPLPAMHLVMYTSYWKMPRKTRALIPRPPALLPPVPYNCQALIYRAALVGDTLGYEQAIADALEHFGVVPNDKWLETWDGSRPLVDRANPRVEVTLTALPQPVVEVPSPRRVLPKRHIV